MKTQFQWIFNTILDIESEAAADAKEAEAILETEDFPSVQFALAHLAWRYYNDTNLGCNISSTSKNTSF